MAVKTYSIPFNVAATSAADLVAIESGATKRARITRIVFTNPGQATAATLAVVQLLRTSPAGSGGVVSALPHDPIDTAYTGTVRSGVGVGGGAGAVLKEFPIWVPTATGAFQPQIYDFPDGGPDDDAPTTASGTNNGLALRVNVGAGATGFRGFVEFVEEG